MDRNDPRASHTPTEAEIDGLRQRVAELERALARSQRTENFLDAVLENIPDMIFVKEAKELRFIRFNRAGEELLGIARDQLIGKNDHDFFPPDQAEFFIAKDREVLAGGHLVDIPEEAIKGASGQTKYLHTKKVPLTGEGGKVEYLVGISEDITARKLAAAELDRSRASTDRLEEQRRLREAFVSMLSHDLRTPLTAARTAVELTLRWPQKADLREQMLPRALKALGRAEQMISDLLDANRLEAGQRLPIRLDECDLVRLVRDTLEITQADDGKRLIKLETMGTAEGAIQGFWDGRALRRVIENLLSNAIKYGDETTPIRIRLDGTETEVRIEVHNEGEPIPRLEQANLFQPFVQRPGKKRRGWGLGLALVKGVAEAHSGHVGVESAEGSGTTFTVILPRRAPLLDEDPDALSQLEI